MSSRADVTYREEGDTRERLYRRQPGRGGRERRCTGRDCRRLELRDVRRHGVCHGTEYGKRPEPAPRSERQAVDLHIHYGHRSQWRSSSRQKPGWYAG